MAKYTKLFETKHVGQKRVTIAGSFTTVNGSDPTVTTGQGFTVARDGEGDWSITLSNELNAIDAVLLSVAPKTNTSASVVMEDVDARTATNISLTLEQTADSSSTDFAPADDPGSIISFLVYGRDTNVDDL